LDIEKQQQVWQHIASMEDNLIPKKIFRITAQWQIYVGKLIKRWINHLKTFNGKPRHNPLG
jgi:DNA-binding PadR family transcriptional regulator